MEALIEESERFCRLCMCEDDTILYIIYDEPSVRKFEAPLAVRILACVGIDVIPYDGLPQFICHRCLYNVDMFYEFKEQCEKCDRVLKLNLTSTKRGLKRKSHRRMLSTSLEGFEEKFDIESSDIMEENSGENYFKMSPEYIENDNETINKRNYKLEDCSFQMEESCLSTSKSSSSVDSNNVRIIDSGSTVESCNRNQTATVNTDEAEEKCTAKKKSTEVCKHKFIDVETAIRIQREKFKLKEKPEAYLKLIDCTCPICDISIPFRDFKRHFMSHKIRENESKKFTCLLCEKSFGVKLSLKHHMLIHSSTKSCKCKKCINTTVPNSSSVVKQEETHAESRPFSCHLCQAAYVHSNYLLKHLKKCHNVDTQSEEKIPQWAVSNSDHEYCAKRERKDGKFKTVKSKRENYIGNQDGDFSTTETNFSSKDNKDKIEFVNGIKNTKENESIEELVEVSNDVAYITLNDNDPLHYGIVFLNVP